MSESELIHVEVAYALADQQVILDLDVPLGTTAEQAVVESGVLDTFSDIDLEKINWAFLGN